VVRDLTIYLITYFDTKYNNWEEGLLFQSTYREIRGIGKGTRRGIDINSKII
jgi:hypothetical protein